MSAPAPIVIVGAGECGARAAVALREHGHEGGITLVGEEPHAPYERPPLSKEALAEPRAGGEPGSPPANADAERFEALAVTHLSGARAASLDRAARRLRLADGRELAYDRLLLATGARPRTLELGGAGGAAHALRTHEDAVALAARLRPGARLAILGAGLIGLEVACAARAAGASVTVLERAGRALGRAVPADLAGRLVALHRASGVRMRFDARVAGRGADGAVALDGGERVDADTVLVAIGARPNVELAREAGLEVDDGIVTDATLATADPHVFAAGDCAASPHPLFGPEPRRAESWRNAQDQGELAARNLLGAGAAQHEVPYFWSEQHGCTLEVAGRPELGTRAIVRGEGASEAADAPLLRFDLDADGRLVGAAALGPGRTLAKQVRACSHLIARRARPDPAALADPDVRLARLLAA